MKKLVMIGNGMAGVRTIEEILKLSPDQFEITIFGQEPHPNYNRIKLSNILQGDTSFEDIIINSLEWYKENNIQLFTGEAVTKIDVEAKKVISEQGREVEYDDLIIATGSNSFILPIPGADKIGVTGFRDIKDCEMMINSANQYKKAVVIGGGLLGLEAARGLLNLGMKVDVVHLMPSLMERQLDPIASSLLKAELESQGMNFLMEKETVEITGEVLFPGIYSILPGETLSQVLERAGGLTPHAYPEGAIFSREDLRLLEQKRLDDLQAKLEADIAASNIQEGQGEIDEAEATRLLSNLDAVDAVGRMVINLPRILEKPMAFDFQLEDGDTLTIPRYQPSVTVVGEVQYPTSHFFDNSLDVFEYISRSGGTKPNADSERIYVVKANGQVVLPEKSAWFSRGADDIDPGDTIVVPIDTDRVDSLTMWSSVTQIMYQAALGIAAISSL